MPGSKRSGSGNARGYNADASPGRNLRGRIKFPSLSPSLSSFLSLTLTLLGDEGAIALLGHRRNARSAVRFFLTLIIAAVAVNVPSRAARADGAFPDAQAVLLPRDRPDEVILATNFGLVFTQDDGATWTYSCENDQTLNGFRYVIGPPASSGSDGGGGNGISGDRLYAVSMPPPGLPVSTDDGCSWTLAGGMLTDPSNPAQGADVFPDPSNAARVFALAVPQDPAGAPGSVYRSIDGGMTYAGPLYTPPDDGQQPTMTGVEVSASSPSTVYATWYDRTGYHPHLARSTDGGDSWSDMSIEDQLGPGKPYLAGVDPTDPRTIVLRVLSADNVASPFEGLAVTHDAGQTWTLSLQLAGGTLQGYVRRQDGSLAAIGVMPSTDGTLPTSYFFRSTDAGKSWSMDALPYHAKGLAERNGTLFMATDNFQDLVALVSSDDGKSWKSRLRFDQISAIKSCVYAACQRSCGTLGGLTIFPLQVCDTKETPPPPAKGAGGCSCAAAPTGGRFAGGGGLALALLLAARSRRRSL